MRKPKITVLRLFGLALAMNVASVGGMAVWVTADQAHDARKSQERRSNICAIAEQGDQNVLNLLINASPDPDPSAVEAARLFISKGFEECANPNPGTK